MVSFVSVHTFISILFLYWHQTAKSLKEMLLLVGIVITRI